MERGAPRCQHCRQQLLLPLPHRQEHSACPSILLNRHNEKGDAGEDRGRELCQSEAGTDILDASPLPGYRGDLSQRRTPTSFLRPPGSWKSGRGNPKQAPSTTGLEQAS